MRSSNLSRIILAFYLFLLMLPIYWLINMSVKTNQDIVSGLTLYPHHVTFAKYLYILTDPTWVNGFRVSLTFVAINTIISVTVALPAAYAFNRYSFVGDKHLFFWLLSNQMAPAAVSSISRGTPPTNPSRIQTASGTLNRQCASAIAQIVSKSPTA